MALPTKTPKRITGGILAIVLSVVSLVLITVWSAEGGTSETAKGPLHSVRSAVSSVLMPFDHVSSLLWAPVNSAGTTVEDITASEDTLSALRAQNEELAATVMLLEEYRLENVRLTQLLELSNAYDLESTAAHIIKSSTDSWNQVITIDKGTADGLAAGMPVMSSNGLIGQVESASLYTSQVRLLTDPKSGVSVFLQASRFEGVLKGSFARLLYLDYISLDVEVVPGDVVITSGAGGVYPKGIVIGEVASVTSSPSDVYQTIVVKPSASTKYYEEVLVLTGRQAEVLYNSTSSNNTSNTSGDTSTGGEEE